MNGKGSTARPMAVDDETFTVNWLRTFGARRTPTVAPAEDQHCACGFAQCRPANLGHLAFCLACLRPLA